MGNKLNENENVQQQNLDPENPENPESTGFFSQSFSSALSRLFGLGCIIFLVLGIATLLSAIFWLFPRRSLSKYNGHETVKLNASVQACFRLHKPASKIISHKGKLEMDIFRSIDLKNIKVTVLSLHQSGSSNSTEVKFAVLPVHTHHTIPKHSLTSLRSSFVNLFSQRSHLNLTRSTFGKPTSFQVLKFPGGITVDQGFEPVSGVVGFLFSFTLDCSLSKLQEKENQLKNQLEQVLRVDPFDIVRLVFTNHKGSTISRPVTVRGCVVLAMATKGNHIQHRSDHLAKARAKNLGLDNSVFGEFKSITFTTNLEEGQLLDSLLSVKSSHEASYQTGKTCVNVSCLTR